MSANATVTEINGRLKVEAKPQFLKFLEADAIRLKKEQHAIISKDGTNIQNGVMFLEAEQGFSLSQQGVDSFLDTM